MLSLLLVCALLSTVFSVSVSAEDVESKDFKVRINTKFWNDWNEDNKVLDIYPNNGSQEFEQYTFTNGIPSGTTYCSARETFVIEYTSNEPLLKKDRESTVKLHNAYISMLLTNTANNYQVYDRDIDKVRALVYYSNGTQKYFDDKVTYERPNGTGLYNFEIKFTPEYDVDKIEFITENKATLPSNTTYNSATKVDVYVGEQTSPAVALTITIQSEEAGLLSGMLDWLKGIKNGITDLFESVSNLPSALWNLIENGLKALFVPSDSFIVNFKNDMDTMLSQKLGAVYQVIDVTFDSWEKIEEYDSTNKINFPRVSHVLAGTRFTLGPYDVDIVPKGMEYLVGMGKVIVGIACTVLFVNGLRKRYDEIMGG